MRNLLALVGLLVVVVGVVGWYCGWYTVTVNREPDGNLQIKTNWDTQKAAKDTSAFFEKVGQLVGERGEKNQQSEPPKSPAPSTPAKDNADGGWFAPSRPGGGR